MEKVKYSSSVEHQNFIARLGIRYLHLVVLDRQLTKGHLAYVATVRGLELLSGDMIKEFQYSYRPCDAIQGLVTGLCLLTAMFNDSTSIMPTVGVEAGAAISYCSALYSVLGCHPPGS